jgi:prepilin-type N-terminal cleavage/methylation domain-containing protein
VNSRRLRRAWTLIEVLVVIAIIALLASLFLPSLNTKERMRRHGCRNDMRQFILAAHLYAVDNLDKLPSGDSEGSLTPKDEHIPILARAVRDAMLRYTGGRDVLNCPNWREYFKKRMDWHIPGYGFVLGYNYLGARSSTPWVINPGDPAWTSPQTLSDDGALLLLTDPNNWSTGYARAFVPHTRRGFRFYGAAIDDGQLDFNPANVPNAIKLGGEGGNVGRLDGAVVWKPVHQMQTYVGSGTWGDQGCWAMW